MSRVSKGLVIALLLFLNIVTGAWQWGAFARWGWAPDTVREPERLDRQVRPETIRLESPAAAAERMATEATSAASATDAAKAAHAPGPALSTVTTPVQGVGPHPAPSDRP